MAKDSDIKIVDVEVVFSNERFRMPFILSSGTMNEITYAEVRVTVQNRIHKRAAGIGAILLSSLWAFPGTELSLAEKDQVMRSYVTAIKEDMLLLDGYYDPFQAARNFEDRLRHLSEEYSLPQLASLVCWSPFDAAVHDGWARALGRDVYSMYTGEFLNEDLGFYLGKDWDGLYPGDFLQEAKSHIYVQHVVGIGDPLIQADKVSPPEDGLPVSLDEWIQKEGVSWFKLKVKGMDIEWNISRIIEVYRIAEESLKKANIQHPVMLSIDPNEACPSPEPVIEMLRKLKEFSKPLYHALEYVEQPTSRQMKDYTFTMHGIAHWVPVIMDESLDSMESLEQVEHLGWSGIAIKTCKGHSHAILAYCWAKQKNLFITLQDLTNPGLALVHSAKLFSRLSLSSGGFECNSRQYIPHSRENEQLSFPGLFQVKQGRIDLKSIVGRGIY